MTSQLPPEAGSPAAPPPAPSAGCPYKGFLCLSACFLSPASRLLKGRSSPHKEIKDQHSYICLPIQLSQQKLVIT